MSPSSNKNQFKSMQLHPKIVQPRKQKHAGNRIEAGPLGLCGPRMDPRQPEQRRPRSAALEQLSVSSSQSGARAQSMAVGLPLCWDSRILAFYFQEQRWDSRILRSAPPALGHSQADYGSNVALILSLKVFVYSAARAFTGGHE